MKQSESCSVVSDSFQPHGLYSPWNSPGQNTGVGSLSLLQGTFSTQGSNPGLSHCRRILSQLSHRGSPILRTQYNNTLGFLAITDGNVQEKTGPLTPCCPVSLGTSTSSLLWSLITDSHASQQVAQNFNISFKKKYHQNISQKISPLLFFIEKNKVIRQDSPPKLLWVSLLFHPHPVYTGIYMSIFLSDLSLQPGKLLVTVFCYTR